MRPTGSQETGLGIPVRLKNKVWLWCIRQSAFVFLVSSSTIPPPPLLAALLLCLLLCHSGPVSPLPLGRRFSRSKGTQANKFSFHPSAFTPRSICNSLQSTKP
ncbi:unnamed protein product [Mortierella alpina]